MFACLDENEKLASNVARDKEGAACFVMEIKAYRQMRVAIGHIGMCKEAPARSRDMNNSGIIQLHYSFLLAPDI